MNLLLNLSKIQFSLEKICSPLLFFLVIARRKIPARVRGRSEHEVKRMTRPEHREGHAQIKNLVLMRLILKRMKRSEIIALMGNKGEN